MNKVILVSAGQDRRQESHDSFSKSLAWTCAASQFLSSCSKVSLQFSDSLGNSVVSQTGCQPLLRTWGLSGSLQNPSGEGHTLLGELHLVSASVPRLGEQATTF